MTTTTTLTPQNISDTIGWFRKTDRAARVARTLVHFIAGPGQNEELTQWRWRLQRGCHAKIQVSISCDMKELFQIVQNINCQHLFWCRANSLNKNFLCMTSPVSGQDEPNPALCKATRACKIERYCTLGIARFVPAIKFRRSASWWAKVFFRKIFSVTAKRFAVISLSGGNYKTRKAKASRRMKRKNSLMLMSFKNTFCIKNWHKS